MRLAVSDIFQIRIPLPFHVPDLLTAKQIGHLLEIFHLYFNLSFNLIRNLDMRKHFYQTPVSERVHEGTTVQLMCIPPDADPKAEVCFFYFILSDTDRG
jgi:hypothetical protein